MATTRNKKNTPAPAAPAAEEKKFVPVPDGWYDLDIVDVDPEYRSQTSSQVFRVFKCRIRGSLRFHDRTFSVWVSEALTGEHQGKKFDSQRKQMRDTFGIDPWTNPEGYMDMHVRGHIVTETKDGKTYNRIPGLYKPNAEEAQP